MKSLEIAHPFYTLLLQGFPEFPRYTILLNIYIYEVERADGVILGADGVILGC